MLIELCITCPEILVFAHTMLAIVSGPLMLGKCFASLKVGHVITPVV